MTPDLVSTIIPVFNRARLLEEAVESVLAQTYQPFEIIIVDDGSTDDTTEAIRRLVERDAATIRFIRQENRGPGVAREAGRLLARGEFIQYLDSDDLLLPRKFEIQTGALRSRPGAGVAYGLTQYRSTDGQLFVPAGRENVPRLESMFPALLERRPWHTPTLLFRTTACDSIGPWTDLWLEEDWEYDCRAASIGVLPVFCEEYVVEVRDHAGEHLSQKHPLDAPRLAHRARAHALMVDHAMRAEANKELPEMASFARRLFLLSRQCGAAGLSDESRRLFELAREASTDERSRGADFRIYRAMAGVLGWNVAGRLAYYWDRLKPRRRASI